MTASILVIRIRGRASTPWDIQETLDRLRLYNHYNAMIYPAEEQIVGMIRRVQSYVTWGELNMEGAKAIISRLETFKGKLDEGIIKEKMGITLEEFLRDLVEGRIRLNKQDFVKLPIRLHPPKKGFKGKVNSFLGSGGELGYRGDKINELVRRMV
ncbi:50S ribosomal protein L30 [Metallosphaera yellowstonensis]|nr:50S ribosomal protein L30 [Metallosphaera yellowstonensis]